MKRGNLSMKIQPLPEGTQAVIPYLTVENAAKAMEFYKKVFAAEEMMRLPGPDGKGVMHAEMRVAGCTIYLSDLCMQAKKEVAPSMPAIGLTMYCLDADKVFHRAVKHGAKAVREMTNMFWGDRVGTVVDPFGHHWTLMQRVEVVSPEEMVKRSKQMSMA